MADLRGEFKTAETTADNIFQATAKLVSAHPKTTLAIVAAVGILIVLVVLL